MMATPEIGSDGYYHPADETEVAALILWAGKLKKAIRVRGSAHSVREAIYPGASERSGTSEGITLLLDRMIAVSFDEPNLRVTVQAGCHLGRDPSDAETSTLENGFFKQLHDKGWAVPDMGGIIHQTIGGFLSTGSAGGSLRHSIYDAVVGIRLVDGQGNLHEYDRPADDAADPGHPFFGAVIAMGLLGVVTAVTFRCIPKYHVIGSEATTSLLDAALDLFDAEARGLGPYLRRAEHARLLWWPHGKVRKLQVWEARTMGPGDYTEETGTPEAFRRQAYELLRPFLWSRFLAQVLANRIFRLFGRLNPPPPRGGLGRLGDRLLAPWFAPVVNAMLGPSRPGSPQRFWDDWWHALPMDNQASDRLLPTEFTEAWIRIEHTPLVMAALRDHYATGGFATTGTHACEIYAAKASPFWLSPAYGHDVLRIDLFWFAKNEGNPESDYYPQFWNLLDRFEPRYHWGKHFPTAPAELGARYPRWQDFMALRQQLDPAGRFATGYWRTRLGIVSG